MQRLVICISVLPIAGVCLVFRFSLIVNVCPVFRISLIGNLEVKGLSRLDFCLQKL